MGFLTDILNKIKGATLDRTNIDERIGQGLFNASKSVGNFFTQTLPRFSGSADRYMQNPTIASDILNWIDRGNKSTSNPIRSILFKNIGDSIDTGIGSTYKIGKENWGVNDYLRKQNTLTSIKKDLMQPSEAPKASDYFNMIGLAGVPRVGTNIIGGLTGVGLNIGSNVWNKKPLLDNAEKAFNEGYQFSSKLGPYEEILGATLNTAKNAIPLSLQQKIITNPVVQKVIKGMTKEEVVSLEGLLRNSLRAGQKSGISMAIYGALEDAKDGPERLRNIFEQYKQGVMFGTVQHGLMSGLGELSRENRQARKLADIIGTATDKAHPPLMQTAESSIRISKSKEKPLSDFFIKRKAEVDAQRAQYTENQNNTPIDITKLEQIYAKKSQIPMPSGLRTPEDAPQIRNIANAMEKSGPNFDRTKAEGALSYLFNNATPEQKKALIDTADFNKIKLKDYWKMHIENILGRKVSREQIWKEANQSLMGGEQGVATPQQPIQSTKGVVQRIIEAKKYKSAEELPDTYFHVTNKPDEVLKSGYIKSGWGRGNFSKGDVFVKPPKGKDLQVVFGTTRENVASEGRVGFAGFKITSNLNDLPLNKTRIFLRNSKGELLDVTEAYKSGATTKSQLIDKWNKANEGNNIEQTVSNPEQTVSTDIFKRTTGLEPYDTMMSDKPYDGGGNYSSFQDYYAKTKGKKATIVEMTPDEYLSKIPQEKPSQTSMDKLRGLVKKGVKIDMPSLDYSEGTLAQEGRNRAYLAKEMGIDKIPVAVIEKTSTVSNPDLNVSNSINPEQTVSSQPQNYTRISPKKLSELKGMIQTPEQISANIDALASHPAKATVQGESARVAAKNLIEHGNKIVDDITNIIKKNNITKEQFVDYVENPNLAPTNIRQYIDIYRKLVEQTHSLRENPNLGKIVDYFPHMKEDVINLPPELKDFGNNLLISNFNLKLGSSERRTGTMTDYSKDFNKVMKNYIEQVSYDKYGSRMHDVKVINLHDKLSDHLKVNSDGYTEAPNNKFDYVDESNRAYGGDRVKVNVEKQKIGMETFDHLRLKMQKAGHIELSDAMRDVRDYGGYNDFLSQEIERISKLSNKEAASQLAELIKMPKNRSIIETGLTKRTDIDAKQDYINAILRNKYNESVDSLIKEVGKYEFTPEVRNYLNYEIDKIMKSGKWQENFAEKSLRFLTSMFYHAQIDFGISTAGRQKLETGRVLPLYGSENTAQMVKQRISDKLKGRDVLADYSSKEDGFGNRFDINESKKKQNRSNLISNIWEGYNKAAGKMINITESSKNADFATAAEIEGKKMGLSGLKLQNHVRDRLFEQGLILHRFNTPEVMNNPYLRAALQYQQFAMKEITLLADTFRENKGKAVGLIAQQGVSAAAYAAITGGGMAALTQFSLPLGVGPILSVPYQVFNAIKKRVDEEEAAKNDPEYEQTKLEDARAYYKQQLRDLFMRNVVPSGNQILKTTKSADILGKGYAETAGGRVKYASTDNPLSAVQSLAFGPSSMDTSKAYYKKTGIMGTGGAKHHSINPTRSKYIKDLFAGGNKEKGKNAIQQEMVTQDIQKEFTNSLTPTESKRLAEFFPIYKKDKEGNIIPSYDTTAQSAHAKWNNPELLQKMTDRERAIAKQTGKPLNPFYSLDADQQRAVLRMQTLPVGDPDKKRLQDLYSDWLPDYWAAQSQYDKDAKAQGLRSENPYFDAQRVNISPELQTKLDFYNTLPKGTGARSAFLKENPDVLDFFNQSSILTDVKRLALGLPPVESTNNGYGGNGYRYPNNSYSKMLSRNLALLKKAVKMSVPKKSKLLDTIIKRHKISLSDLKPVTINTKPSAKWTKLK